MTRLLLLGLLLALAPSPNAHAAGLPRARELVREPVDEARLVSLPGNTRPEAVPENDRGILGDGERMENMLLQLKRSPEHQAQLEQFIDDLHNPSHPGFHQWLTAKQFGEQFGVAPADRAKVVAFLRKSGFAVRASHSSGMVIAFSGTAGQVMRAFHLEMHALEVRGERHIANMSDPRIPAALAPVVEGVVALHDFQPRMGSYDVPAFNAGGATLRFLVPGDAERIYNEEPLFHDKIFGKGQTIALLNVSNLDNNADWTLFRELFNLNRGTNTTLTIEHPNSEGGPRCDNPGVTAASIESISDVEWASATAPGANLILATCKTEMTPGYLIALLNLIDVEPEVDIVSVSYEGCEPVQGAAKNAADESAFAEATALGISVFVASGDQGAADCDDKHATLAVDGVAVNGVASTRFNVAVGGTDFRDLHDGTTDTYWEKTNRADFSSVKSYVPEIPWNSSCASNLLAGFEGSTPLAFCNSRKGSEHLTVGAAGGGPSGCATGTPSPFSLSSVSGSCAGRKKPSWQKNVGGPDDGVRDVPDVSLFAATRPWGHKLIICHSTPDNGDGSGTCTRDPKSWQTVGGTSLASPMMAGIQALVNEFNGGKQGLPNYAYYQLAAKQYGASYDASCNANRGNRIGKDCVFHDVVSGSLEVPCEPGTPDCFSRAEDAVGLLGVTDAEGDSALKAHERYDLATGLGSVDANNLVRQFGTVRGEPTPPPPDPHAACIAACDREEAVCMDSAHDSAQRQLCVREVQMCRDTCDAPPVVH